MAGIKLVQMMEYCKKNNVTNYADFVDWCKDNHKDWFRILCSENEENHPMIDYFKSI